MSGGIFIKLYDPLIAKVIFFLKLIVLNAVIPHHLAGRCLGGRPTQFRSWKRNMPTILITLFWSQWKTWEVCLTQWRSGRKPDVQGQCHTGTKLVGLDCLMTLIKIDFWGMHESRREICKQRKVKTSMLTTRIWVTWPQITTTWRRWEKMQV